MIGHGSPMGTLHACARLAAMALALTACAAVSPAATADALDVRLRLAWGGGGPSPQKWHGKITVSAGKLSALQPLGIEADEAAALRLVDNQIIVAPLVRRAFDGCDVTIRADEMAVVTIELQNSTAAAPKVIEVPLAKLAAEQFRAPLDELGSYLLAHRAPGDKLRVRIDRDHLVFQPGEAIELALDADLKAEASQSPLTIKATLHGAGSADELWQTTIPYAAASADPIALTLAAPAEEGAYRLSIVAKQPESLAGRLVPWDQAAAIASRDVELVVVDPARWLPRLIDTWEVISTIDPASSSWWQRIPQWTQFDRLPGFSTPRPLGNVKPAPVTSAQGRLVELPAAAMDHEPAWQAYLLPVRRVGQPHAVEIEVPRGNRQHLAVSVIEPDAAGRVLTFGRDCGVYGDDHASTADRGAVDVHRIVFWPRTKSPALLLSNRSPTRPAQYGKIKLLLRSASEAPTESTEEAALEPQGRPARLVAAYVGTPRFAESFGAAEQLDPISGFSVDGWNTFLVAANRLAQQTRAAGYNAAIVSIAADGSSLAPIAALGASPRYDAGLLAASGSDPFRKDVLEVLLRVFDREGLRLIPAVQLTTPLPGLEALNPRDLQNAAESGLTWVGSDGRTWSEQYGAETAARPHYNLLHPNVQEQLAAVADQLVARYAGHPAFGGVALQLAGNGYGVLPGLAWGMDESTVARFVADTKITLPTEGPDRLQQRAELLLGPRRADWSLWRQNEVTKFYAEIAARVAGGRKELQLVLCAEDVFYGPEASERVRQAVAGRASLNDALSELGIDVARLAATPNVTLLRPRRLGADESIDNRALDMRVNSAPELDSALAAAPNAGELFYHAAARLRLPSFDAQSPFGVDRTFLSLSSPSVAAGDAGRQALITALAGRDFLTLADGAEIFPLAENSAHAAALRTFQELPPPGGGVRTERRQPISLRVYREAESTTVCLINESPWPVDLRLPLEADAPLVWRQLGADPAATAAKSQATGSLPAGAQAWSLTLPPYGLEARRFSSRTIRIGAFTPQIASIAREKLARRVAEIELRMPSLDIERPYPELQNPQFELVGDDKRFLGWQLRGAAGIVEASEPAAAGAVGRALNLRSEDNNGVTVQSHLFPIPTTGQLVLRAKVRTNGAQSEPRIYAWVEYQSGAVWRQRFDELGREQPLTAAWSEQEFAVDDLPLAAGGQMRILFHIAGRGEAWVDDVRLYDLRFSRAQRIELSRDLYAAKTALEEGQWLDCQRKLEGYMARRLVEHVPPISIADRPADARPAASPAAAEKSKGINDRLRGIVPRILR